jgi:hypothetical protein
MAGDLLVYGGFAVRHGSIGQAYFIVDADLIAVSVSSLLQVVRSIPVDTP